MDHKKGVVELISSIETKDRRFRFALGIFMMLIALALLAVFMVQFNSAQASRDQGADRQREILKLQQHNDEEFAKQTRYIQCIAQFFATKDRASRVLTDLDNCSFLQDGQPVTGVVLPATNVLPGDSIPGQSVTPTTIPSSTGTTPQTANNDLVPP